MLTRLNLLLLVVLVVCGLGLVASRFHARMLFAELEREQNLARQFDVEWGQLQLEQSTLATPGRVDKTAREQLHMLIPTVGRTLIVDASQKVAP